MPKIWVEDDSVEMYLAADGDFADNGTDEPKMYFESVDAAKQYLRGMVDDEYYDDEIYYQWLDGVIFHEDNT